jgi:hypothetical protein
MSILRGRRENPGGNIGKAIGAIIIETKVTPYLFAVNVLKAHQPSP